MSPFYSTALKAVWGVVITYWLWNLRGIKPVTRTEPAWKRAVQYWLPVFIGTLLLGPGEWFGHSFIRDQFVPHSYVFETIGLSFCILGAVISIWSRRLLGKNWSLAVQLKRNHELIQDGPYRVVRHPIYSGLTLMFLGNAVMVGDWRGLIAVLIIFSSFYFKSTKEEKWLTEYFPDRYTAYKARTKMIIPGIL